MKNLKTALLFAFLFLLQTTVVSANAAIEGRWKNLKAKVSLLVEKTSTGIRVKRLDRANWIKYESTRPDQFRDAEGNTYQLTNDSHLEWESYDGRRRIAFARLDQISSTAESIPSTTKHIERNHYYGKNINRSLRGRWINKSTGQSIYVKERRNSIRVKARRGGWVTFRPRTNRTFVDQQDNRYQLKNGRLSYTSYSGDFYMRFVKY